MRKGDKEYSIFILLQVCALCGKIGTHACMYVHMYTHMNIYIDIYMYMHMHMYIYIYIYTYIHISPTMLGTVGRPGLKKLFGGTATTAPLL